MNGGPQQTWYDTAYLTFEYTNGLCSKFRSQDGGSDGYCVYEYEYNNQKLPIKRTARYTSNDSIELYTFYKYDALNNLIEAIDSADKVNHRYSFAYNSNNNLTSATMYISSIPQKIAKYEWLSFDNKVNFIKAVNGLPLTFTWDNNWGAFSSSSPNNIIDQNYYVPVSINQTFGQANYQNFSYQYNDEGLPIKSFSGPWTVTYEYEKYK